MKFILIIELTFAVLGILLLLTQILIPLVRGRPLFPLLRPKERRVESAIAKAKENLDVAAREQTLEELTRTAGQ